MISPDQYLGESARNRFVPVSLPDELRGIYSPAVEQYAVRARQGEKMPIPVIDRVNHEQEGRHRAMVAKKLGLKKIPVLFIERA
jgi:hypothetical protein